MTGSCSDEPVERSLLQTFHQILGGVEADEMQLPRPAVVLEHAHRREARRFVRAEDPVDAQAAVRLLVGAENGFGALVRFLDVGAARTDWR